MFSFVNEQYKFYLEEYHNFTKSYENNYTLLASGVFYDSEICQVMRYDSLNDKTQKNFLIVNSIFNSPEIFFLNKKDNLIQSLQKLGNVYLVDWNTSELQMNLEDYANELVDILDFMHSKNLGNIHLIGHCIGGVIAIGASILNSRNIDSLSLFTTPWNYSHFYNPVMWQKSLSLDLAYQNSDFIPKIYLQIMFFMLFPNQFYHKMSKYYALENLDERLRYLQVEYWLQSGKDISRRIYHEITDDLVQKNMLEKKAWVVSGIKIDPIKINFPICLVSAKNDKIAPPSSMESLRANIKNISNIEVEGGHIGYLVKNDQNFKKSYLDWICLL